MVEYLVVTAGKEGRKMRTSEIKQVVKTRYGRFAETGGKPESC